MVELGVGALSSPLWAARSHVGRVRLRNEDAFVCQPELGLFAVADGLGGLVAGDRASRAVVEALASLRPAPELGALDREVERALAHVHDQLQAQALSIGPSGSTVVVLLLRDDQFRILWCGDSRAARLRDGQLEWLTTDHNLASELVRRRQLRDEEARRHPLASRLTHAVGVDAELYLDRLAGRIRPGDLFLLCSDGLSGELSDREIAACLADGDLEAAAARLLAEALAQGGRDNVTFVLVRPQQGLAAKP